MVLQLPAEVCITYSFRATFQSSVPRRRSDIPLQIHITFNCLFLPSLPADWSYLLYTAATYIRRRRGPSARCVATAASYALGQRYPTFRSRSRLGGGSYSCILRLMSRLRHNDRCEGILSPLSTAAAFHKTTDRLRLDVPTVEMAIVSTKEPYTTPNRAI